MPMVRDLYNNAGVNGTSARCPSPLGCLLASYAFRGTTPPSKDRVWGEQYGIESFGTGPKFLFRCLGGLFHRHFAVLGVPPEVQDSGVFEDLCGLFQVGTAFVPL